MNYKSQRIKKLEYLIPNALNEMFCADNINLPEKRNRVEELCLEYRERKGQPYKVREAIREWNDRGVI